MPPFSSPEAALDHTSNHDNILKEQEEVSQHHHGHSTIEEDLSLRSTWLGRRVRFSDYDDVFEIRHIDDMSSEEIDYLWLSRECLYAIREECRSIVQLINEGCAGEIHIRGLDQHTARAVSYRKALQDIIYEAVGRVQEVCKKNNLALAPCLMADLCQKYSSVSAQRAIDLAKNDETQVYS